MPAYTTFLLRRFASVPSRACKYGYRAFMRAARTKRKKAAKTEKTVGKR